MKQLQAESLDCHVQSSWVKQKVINLVDRRKEMSFLVLLIGTHFFYTGTLHLVVLFIGFTSVELKILSSPSDHVEIVSVVLPTPVHNSFVFTVIISKRKYFNDSERSFCWTNDRIFDFLWVRSVVPDHVSSFLTPWSWFVTKLSRKIFVVQEASLCSCVLIIDSRESMIIDQKQCSSYQKICIWSDYYRPLIYN